jgi:hypothetical protein
MVTELTKTGHTNSTVDTSSNTKPSPSLLSKPFNKKSPMSSLTRWTCSALTRMVKNAFHAQETTSPMTPENVSESMTNANTGRLAESVTDAHTDGLLDRKEDVSLKLPPKPNEFFSLND